MSKLDLSKMTIQSVSEKLGLPKSTLRYWEKELPGLIRPERTAGGQRRYALKDIAAIETVRDLRQEGYSLVQIKARFESEPKKGDHIDPSAIDVFAERIADTFRRELYQLLNLKIKA